MATAGGVDRRGPDSDKSDSVKPARAKSRHRRGPRTAKARRLSATGAARRFSDVLNRVAYRGGRFVIERGGEAVCEIVPARRGFLSLAELAQLVASPAAPDRGYWTDVLKAASGQPHVPPSPWER